MSANFSRVKNWNAETLTNEDLNAEIDNILNNFGPAGMGDYSSNATEMQTTEDPGEVGSESLATSLAEELARIRFVLQEIKGSDATQWYTSVGTNISELQTAVGSALASNRISQGKVDSGEQQANFLTPAGSGRTVTLEGSATSFIYFIEGTQYTISSDVTATNLQLAPSSNNTCLVNDSNAADGEETTRLGMYKSEISVDTMGSEITGLVGTYQYFSINNGSETEYFRAYIESTTKLTKCNRGFFFDSSNNHVPAIVFSDNDTITLLKKTFIFAKNDGTLAVTYNDPVWSGAEPSSPQIGDYWFDLVNDKWKTFNSVAYVDADATFIGVCAQDATNTVAARSEDIFKNFDDVNTLILEHTGVTSVSTTQSGQKINVNGQLFDFRYDSLTWDITSDLESGFTEAASTLYFLYVTEDGVPKISPKPPLNLKGTRAGYYHPARMWRCVGHIENDSGSDLDATTLVSFANTNEKVFWSNDTQPVGSYLSTGADKGVAGYVECDQTQLSRFEYAELYAYMGNNSGTTNAYNFTLPGSQGRFMRYHADGSGNDPDRGSRTAATGGASGDNVGSYQADEYEAHNHTSTTSDIFRNTGGGSFSSGGGVSQVFTSVVVGNSGGSETRPKNWYAKCYMKARNG